MATDHSATTRETDQVATSSVGSRQASLTEVTDDGSQQTTLGTLDGGARPDRTDDGGDDLTPVNAFPMRNVLLVKHYFEGDAAFGVLQPYYDQREYRFEVPQSDLERVQDELAEHGYRLRVVDYVAPFAVVVRKYSHHPESVFEDAVAQFSNADFNVFLLKDQAAVETAIRSGATPLEEAPVDVRFPAARGTGPLTVADVTAD